MLKDLSIIFCERGVIRGQALDRRVLGKPLSHPFLVMKDGEDVVSELHGTWSARCCVNDNQPKLSKKLELSLAVASITGQAPRLSSVFEATFPKSFPVNRMVELQGNRQYKLAARESELVSGEETQEVWQHLTSSARVYDAIRFPYVRYAFGAQDVNCQKTMRALLENAEIDTSVLSLELGEAGWDRAPLFYSAACEV
ncbi:MAG: hypothetical protein JKY71_01945 [Alphaproteobacteria bacterium]|nr:hypothetical protein [Alphaproteobacteria bacterium]